MSKDKYSKLFTPSNIQNTLRDIMQVFSEQNYDGSNTIMCESDNMIFTVKVCFYRITVPEPAFKDKHIIHQSEMEYRALELMRDLLDQGLLDTVVRLYHIHTLDNMAEIIPNQTVCDREAGHRSFRNWLCKYKHLIKEGLALNKCTFLVMEQCDITLSDFLVRYVDMPINFDILRTILFRVIFTLWMIKKIYPQFHHYDLHIDNILLKIEKYIPDQYIQHIVGKTNFYLPDYGITPKIIDFEYAVIPEANIVSAATLDRLTAYQRPQNDLVLSLFWIYTTLHGHNLLTDDIERMLHDIEPNETYKKYEIYHIRKVEDKIPSYHEMLKCRAFSSYKTKPTGKIVKQFGKK